MGVLALLCQASNYSSPYLIYLAGELVVPLLSSKGGGSLQMMWHIVSP